MGLVSVSVHDYENGGWFADPQNRLRQKAYNLLDASAFWTTQDACWEVRLYGKNLTSRFYAAQLAANAPFGDYYEAAPGRLYGVTVGLHF
jgi:iron complex outermembrane recepter protein